jgi:4-hydroxybenzoate-CoA ligase
VDRHRSGGANARAAFVEAGPAGRTLTYEDLALQSDRMAAIYERHGLRPEDRAVMLVLDQIEFPVIFWGSLKAGVIPIPINTLLSADAYKAILMDCRARALFVSGQLFPSIEPVLGGNPYLKAIFVIAAADARNGSAPPGPGARLGRNNAQAMDFSSELAASERREMLAASPDECSSKR